MPREIANSKREVWTRVTWIITATWVAVLLGSLRYGWLDHFFFDTSHAQVQGIDFFPVERAWLNLTNGLSEFDTFASNYGPHATLLIYHPAFAVVLGPLLMAFTPWTAYGVWTCISFALMAAAAAVIMRRGADPLRRALVALLMLGAFPTFLVFYSGNVQAVIVLALALLFAAVDDMRENGVGRGNERMLLAALLLSLFSKPMVLAFLPLLLLVEATRGSTLRALGIYLVVSFAFLTVPALNPAATSWAARMHLAGQPTLIASTMNWYTNGHVVTAGMQDNGFHWLSIMGLADFRLLHIDVYSLPALLDGWLHTRTPEALYRVPGLLLLEVSVLVWFIRDKRDQLEATLFTLMAGSLVLFLSYGLVWEFHYSGVLPIGALLLMRTRMTKAEKVVVALCTLCALPSLYIFLGSRDVTLLSVQSALRAERIVPVVLLFVLLLGRAIRLALTSKGGLGLTSAAGLRRTALPEVSSSAHT